MSDEFSDRKLEAGDLVEIVHPCQNCLINTTGAWTVARVRSDGEVVLEKLDEFGGKKREDSCREEHLRILEGN
jgi:hypothetical protein